MKPFRFLLEDELYEQLRKLAYEQRKSMAEIIREALKKMLGGNNNETAETRS